MSYPILTAAISLLMLGLASVKLVEIIPAFESAVASPYFPFLLQTHELLALIFSLYVAYRWHSSLGMIAILLFLAYLVPYFIVRFTTEFPALFHLLLTTLITLLGIRLIERLRRALEMTQQRERELRALAELNVKVLNERIQFLQEATQKKEQMVRLHQALSLACSCGAPLEVARKLLSLVQEAARAHYASFTLVGSEGTLEQSLHSFWGIKPFTVAAFPDAIGEAILKSQETQYVADTKTDPRANPNLVANGIRSYLGLPIKTEERLRGLLLLHSIHPNAFQEENEFIETITQVLASTLLRVETPPEVKEEEEKAVARLRPHPPPRSLIAKDMGEMPA